ncbi:MAG TPA: site-specific DNA-methyltransferase [Rhodocyclaceae bacterium]|nr:site-specific DNA-methyltransferase [Rhodocyclaceae bacterium]
MQKIEPYIQPMAAGSPEAQSADLKMDNIATLKALFPELLTERIVNGKAETAINVDVLKQLVGDTTASDTEEKYGLNWHGKRRARQIALTPSTGTLRPCPEDSVDWDTTQNLMIEGDNLEVLKLLQKSYTGKVKLIYIDPPYNTGKDFVYPDNFQDNIKNYLELTGQVQGGRKISSNTEASGRFHTDWLNMMYPRLRLARNLLRDDGVIFISIDDGESANLQAVLNEIFGEENFQANISWQKRYTRSNNTIDFTTVVEHILVYSKTDDFSVNLLERTREADSRYSNPDNDSRGPWKGASLLNPATPDRRPNLCYPIQNPNTGKITNPTTNAWRRSREEFHKLQSDGRLYWGSNGEQAVPAIKMFLSEAREITPINFWEHGYAGNTDDGTRDLRELLGEKVFDNPKPVQLIERVLEHGADEDSVILDFFAGSGTTGNAVFCRNAADQGHKRFILVQLPEPIDSDLQRSSADFCDRIKRPKTIAEITKERMRRAGEKVRADNPLFAGDMGFRVFKLDTSNIRAWSPNRDDLEGSLLANIEHVQPGRSDIDVLYELLLKLGLDLCVPIEARQIAGKTVHSIGGGVLMACLESRIAVTDAEALALGMAAWRKEQAPAGDTTAVFRDSAFDDDVSKTNLSLMLQQSGISQVRSL